MSELGGFELIDDDVFVIRQFVPRALCEQWRDRAEEQGFTSAPVPTKRGAVHRPEVRNNERVIVDDVAWADQLWRRASEQLPESWRVRHVTTGLHTGHFEACGLNERLRFYRYSPGQRFRTHRDGYFAREDGSGEVSMLTMLLFLNEGFGGGQTRLMIKREPVEIVPEQGMALLFRHAMLHEGVEVEQGTKYVLRTDVMYRPIEGA